MHMISAFTSLALPPSQREAPFHSDTFFPCFFSLSPMEDKPVQEDFIKSYAIQPSIVFLFWLFLLHVPFQMIGSCVAAGLKYFDVIAVDENFPWYGIDPILRVSTTVADAARISFWVALRGRYDTAMKSAAGLVSGRQGSEDNHQSANHTDYKSIDLIHNNSSSHITPPTSSIFPTQEWINLAFWSTLAWPLRMGDSFRLAGMYESFWTPLAAYGVSRVAALAIGSIPGCIGGIPSLTTSLGLGIFYASQRDQFERKVEFLLEARRDGQSGLEETCHDEMKNEVMEQHSTWGYRLRMVLSYAYFTCFMVLWDAVVLNVALMKKVEDE